MSEPAKIAGLVWYRAEHYLAIKELFDDGQRLPATFEKWRQGQEHAEAAIQAKGIRTVRAYIDPKEFTEWCRARGLAINAQARNQFANWVAYNAHKDGKV